MNLLKLINQINYKDIDLINKIIECLEDRLETVELQEPFDSGYFYDKWEEKYEGLEDLIEDIKYILDDIQSIKDESQINKIEKDLDDFKNSLFTYQIEFGGLKRLKI